MRPAEDPARGPRLSHALALGVLQGPTELLPVSSSAHTALIPWLAGWSSYTSLDPEQRKAFEVALHLGAGAALALDMRGELGEAVRGLNPRRVATIGLSLAPAVLAGYALERPIERRLGGPRSIAAGLIVGGIAMAVADLRSPARAAPPGAGARKEEDVGPMDGLVLGIAQAAALMPGVSRSGATLTAGRARGFARRDAHTLSWHVALPVILGAGVLKGRRLVDRESAAPGTGSGTGLAVGAVSAFGSTLASARVARRWQLGERPLLPFGVYRCLLAGMTLLRVGRDGGGAQNMKG